LAISSSFMDYVLEQLIELGDVKVKKMFGGAALYYGGLIFALIADDVLYFKVDDSNRLDYAQKNMKPFKPFDDKPMLMPYYEVPVDILENRNKIAEWARKSLFVSKNTHTQVSGKKRKNKLLIF